MALPRFRPETLDTPAMREVWRRDGLLVIDRFFAVDEVAALRTRAAELRRDCARVAPSSVFDAHAQSHAADAWFRESGEAIRAFFEPDTPADLPERARARWVNKLGHALHDLDPTFDRILRSDRLAGVADVLGLADPRIVQSMVIFKEAHIGDAVPPHQDATYLATDPQTVCGFWIALDRAAIHNGCLRVQVGGHDGPLRARFVRDDETLELHRLDDTPFDLEAFAPIEAEPGTLVVFHGLTPHGSEPNRSDASRWAVTLHVVDGAARWCDANWLVRRTPFRGFRRSTDPCAPPDAG